MSNVIHVPKRRSGASLIEPYYTYEYRALDASPSSTQNWSSVPIGTADASRMVVVAAGADENACNGCTINGVTATKIAQGTGPSSRPQAQLWAAMVPTGTSVTITMTHTGNPKRATIGVWAVYNKATVTAADVSEHSNDPSNISLTPGGAPSVLIGFHFGDVGTHTWSDDLTEDFDQNSSGNAAHSGASSSQETAGTFTSTGNWPGGNGTACAAWLMDNA